MGFIKTIISSFHLIYIACSLLLYFLYPSYFLATLKYNVKLSLCYFVVIPNNPDNKESTVQPAYNSPVYGSQPVYNGCRTTSQKFILHIKWTVTLN